jgi:hypothetical protein
MIPKVLYTTIPCCINLLASMNVLSRKIMVPCCINLLASMNVLSRKIMVKNMLEIMIIKIVREP